MKIGYLEKIFQRYRALFIAYITCLNTLTYKTLGFGKKKINVNKVQ